MAELGCDPGSVPQSPTSPSLALSKSPTIGETEGGGGGERAALTFLVLPRALREEQLVLSVWEVGWEKLTHEGAGRKESRLANRAPVGNHRPNHPNKAACTAVISGSLTAVPTGRCYCAHFTHLETEALRG